MSPHDDRASLRLRRAATTELTADEIDAVRGVLWAAFEDVEGGMTEDDWSHAIGGVHVLLERDGAIVGHASVVERELHIESRPLRTGYVEAVAIDPRFQRIGLGSKLLLEIGTLVRERFELGALATGRQAFYERHGWLRWEGPTFVRTPTGPVRTAEDDDGILVLTTPTTPFELDRSVSISCEWRTGDAW